MEFKNYAIGQKVTIGADYVENYEVSEQDVFYVKSVATSVQDHPGYDEAMEGMPLYDLVDDEGNDFDNSLYEYELVEQDMNEYEIAVAMKSGYLPNYSFPGSYPMYYVIKGNGAILCGDCATKVASEIMHHDCHMEGAPITCDECNEEIESAYGNPYEGEDVSERLAEMHLRLQSSEFNDHDGTGDLDAYGDPFED